MADLNQRFLKIDPRQPAECDGNNQDDDRKSEIMPGAKPRDPPKKHAQEKLVEQVSTIRNDAQPAQPPPAEAMADPTVSEEKRVEQENQVCDRQPGETLPALSQPGQTRQGHAHCRQVSRLR